MADPNGGFSNLDIALAMRSGARGAEIAMIGARSSESGLNISARNAIAQNLFTFALLGLENQVVHLLNTIARMPSAQKLEIMGRVNAIIEEQKLIQPIPPPRVDEVPVPIPHPPYDQRFPRPREGKDALIEDMKFEEEIDDDASFTDDESEAMASPSFGFFEATIQAGLSVNNPGAGWGGSSLTNEGGFATIDSNGNITNSVTGQTIGQSTINTTNTPSISVDSGGNTID
jgi:hypothetical protein